MRESREVMVMAQTIEEIRPQESLIGLLKLFPRQGEWTEADYFRLPETNKIIELSEGRLIISPSPTTQHQQIVNRLNFLLYSHVFNNSLGEVVTSPMDVRLWKGNIRQPDIVFMSNKHRKRITRKYFGVPDLVMEILSKGTAKVDKEEKFQEYEKAGILEYWIVDPFKKNIAIYALENGIYELFGKWGIGEIAKSKLLDGFEVSIDNVMV
jgi:Uma2 family endonuclease